MSIYLHLTQGVWNIILDYLNETEMFEYNDGKVSNVVINHNICALTIHSNDVFEGFDNIMSTYLKHKRTIFKRTSRYQLTKFIECATMCVECDKSYFKKHAFENVYYGGWVTK